MTERRPERRRFRRAALSCPVRLEDADQEVVALGKTLNVSDSGAYLVVNIESLRRLGKTARVEFSVPRSTPNTYMLEKFSAQAHVLRHEPMLDDRHAGVALQFDQPLALGLTD